MLIAFFFLSQEFHTFEFALLKTFAMTLGEMDYENDFILQNSEQRYPEAVNVVFVLFCLAMPIILMNMLVCHFLVYNTVIKLLLLDCEWSPISVLSQNTSRARVRGEREGRQ